MKTEEEALEYMRALRSELNYEEEKILKHYFNVFSEMSTELPECRPVEEVTWAMDTIFNAIQVINDAYDTLQNKVYK